MIRGFKATLVATLLLAPLATASYAAAANSHANFHAVCPGPPEDSGRCHADVVTDERGNPLATSAPAGLAPADFHQAYNLPVASPVSQTIGIVDAYGDPTVESDLAVYSQTYGLPGCTSGTGCLRVIGQSGSTRRLPRTDQGWALEISLDVQVAHATCQSCKLLLVEANSNRFSDLLAAVDQAYVQGASVISNSYGAGEFSSETSYDVHFDHPGVPITASSGDGGYGAEYPAASRFVTAVGGTTLSRTSGTATGWSESAWSGAGSGCSAYESKPSWQHDSGCAARTVADVAADADPASGAAVYDNAGYQGRAGWFQVGGTSLAAPLVAGVYALAGNGAQTKYASSPYSHLSNLTDIVTGSNGSCSVSYLCKAGAGFDGPTGLGSPNGVAAF
jgi:subtilase family serine protease